MSAVESGFVFAGYLVLEGFLRRFPGREQFLLASPDLRNCHPAFESPTFESVDGLVNYTNLQLALPDACAYPGWTINGYAIDGEWISKLTDEVSFPDADLPKVMPRYSYAFSYTRPKDDLILLGYDVLDGGFVEFLSIAHNCDYAVEDLVRLSGEELNKFGLFPTPKSARSFARNAQAEDPQEGHLELPVPWEVWGIDPNP